MPCDRRTFVRAAGAGVCALALPSCASVAAIRLPRDGDVVRLAVADHPALISPGFLKVMPDGFTTPLWVVAGEDGFLALSAVCQHLGCTVDRRGDRFVCPCHGSTYARDGSVLRGPTVNPLIRFPVEHTAAGEILIRVGT